MIGAVLRTAYRYVSYNSITISPDE